MGRIVTEKFFKTSKNDFKHLKDKVETVKTNNDFQNCDTRFSKLSKQFQSLMGLNKTQLLLTPPSLLGAVCAEILNYKEYQDYKKSVEGGITQDYRNIPNWSDEDIKCFEKIRIIEQIYDEINNKNNEMPPIIW